MRPRRRKAKATVDYGAQHDTHVRTFEHVARELFIGIIELDKKGRFRRRYFKNGSAEDRLARAALMRVMNKWLPLLAASPRHGDADILLHLIAAFDLDENKIKPPLNEVRDRKIMLLNRKKKMPLDLMAAAQIVRAGDTKDVMKAYGLERRTAQKLRNRAKARLERW